MIALGAICVETDGMGIPGSNIRLLRQQMGLTQKALAEAVGMDMGNLSRLETGKSGYSRENIERIAEVLSVSVGVLFAEPGIVEAAALRMRQVPVLTAEQLAAWRGAESLEFSDEQRYLHTDLRRVSAHCFALRVEDEANAPRFRVGDELIFDAKKVPAHGSFVAAVDADGGLHLGRFREMRPVDGVPVYDVIPYDRMFPIVNSLSTPGLTLKGTLSESRRYV